MRASCIAGCMMRWARATTSPRPDAHPTHADSTDARSMMATRAHPDELIVGLVSISDRASAGVYTDQGLPGLKDWLGRALASPWQSHERLIADERAAIEGTLVELV